MFLLSQEIEEFVPRPGGVTERLDLPPDWALAHAVSAVSEFLLLVRPTEATQHPLRLVCVPVLLRVVVSAQAQKTKPEGSS